MAFFEGRPQTRNTTRKVKESYRRKADRSSTPPPIYSAVEPTSAPPPSAIPAKTTTQEPKTKNSTDIGGAKAPEPALEKKLHQILLLVPLLVDLLTDSSLLCLRYWRYELLKLTHAQDSREQQYARLVKEHPTITRPADKMADHSNHLAENTPLPNPHLDEEPDHWSKEVLAHQLRSERKFKPFNANDAPRFAGIDVTDFVEAFEDYCHDRAIPLQECISRIPRQCTTAMLKETVLELPTSLGRDWTAFRKALLKEFEDTDPQQYRHTEDYLSSLKATEDTSADKLESFCNKWVAAERVILAKGRRSTAELTRILFNCLTPGLIRKVVVGTNLDRSKAETLYTAIVITNLRKEVEKKRAFERVMGDTPRELRQPLGLQDAPVLNTHPSARTDAEGYRPQVNFAEKTPAFATTTQRNRANSGSGPGQLPPALRQRAPSFSRSSGSDMDGLTERFATMAMGLDVLDKSMRDLPNQFRSIMSASVVPQNNHPVAQNNFANARPAPPRYPAPATNQYNAPPAQSQYPPNGANQYPQPANALPRPPCTYCGEAGHGKRSCDILWSDIQDGHCHEQGNYVHEGRAGAGGASLDPRGLQGRPLRDRLNIPAVPAPGPAVKVSTIGVVRTPEVGRYASDTATDSSDSEDDYGAVRVNATRAEKKRSEDPWKEDAKEVLRKRSAREAKLPTTRNKSSREGWKPVVTIEDEPIIIDEPVYNASAPKGELIAPATERKARARKGQTWLQTQMGDQDPEKYLKKILKSAKLEVTLWDMMSCSPTLQDLMFRKLMVPLDTAMVRETSAHQLPEVRVNSVRLNRHGKIHYLEDTPKIRCRVGHAIRSCMGLIDTGAEVNVITAGLAAEARIPVRPDPLLSMRGHTGHTKPFSGVCENVDIDVGGVSVKGNFFVLPESDHNLVLGNPFIKYARLSFRYDGSGRQFASVADQRNDEVEILASDRKSAKDLQYERSLIRGKARLA